jgi:hypothetical protein
VTLLKALRNRRARESQRGTEPEPSPPDDQHPVPISGYDELSDKQINDQLSQLAQVELATVEAYEREHAKRPAVLDKLRFMRGREPLPGYDDLTTEQIGAALADADAATVRAVRDYERKFQHRRSVLDEAARVLPTSRASADEEHAQKEKAALLREGYADRERTAPDPPE